MKRLALALVVAAAATSCGRGIGPTPIALASHPSVLQGTWAGTLARQGGADQALRLELTASYDTAAQYRVAGTGTLDTDAVTVTGAVTGGSARTYLRSQDVSPSFVPESARLTLQRAGGDALTLLCLSRESAPNWAWDCAAANGAATTVLKKEVQ